MEKKKILVTAIVVTALIGIYAAFNLFGNNNTPPQKESSEVQEKITDEQPNISQNDEDIVITDTKPTDVSKGQESVNTTFKGEIEHSDTVKQGNLYTDIPSGQLPLSAITTMVDLPKDIQSKVDKVISSSNNIFLLKRKPNSVLIVSENQNNIRHGIDFIEIATPSGHQTVSTFGYNGKIKDSENDIWEYEQITKLPTKHTKYNNEGDVEFTEIWNYDSDEPVKYEMKNAEGKTISIRKETLTDGSNLRIEHLLYDSNGNTKANITTTYEGADIKRFTYYNADKPSDGGSVFSEYNDGLKIKETVYSNDLKINNTYEAGYKNGIRQDIKILDSKNNLSGTIESL